MRRFAVTALVLALLAGLGTMIVSAYPESWRNAIGLSPYAGTWDRFGIAHPPTHPTSQVECDAYGCFGPGDWAVDYYAGAGTALRFAASSNGPSNNYGVNAQVDAISPTCAGGVQGGKTVFVDLWKDGYYQGWIAYAHVNNVQVSVGRWISNGTLLGYTKQWAYSSCYQVSNNNGVHTHIEMYDRHDWACYVNYASNTNLSIYQWIGDVGDRRSSVQPCF